MENELTEAESREVKLEAICNAMYECFEKAVNEIPFNTPNMELASQLMDHLFNQAEVRSDINEWCHVKVEFEEE